MTVLIISICLMALIRYGMSHRRKKIKDAEIEDEQRIMSSASAGNPNFFLLILCNSVMRNTRLNCLTNFI